MNKTDPILCFTDASYSQQKSLSVVGYKIDNFDITLEKLDNVLLNVQNYFQMDE